MCLTTQEEKDNMAKKTYQIIVGSLMYTAITMWTEISFAVQQLSPFTHILTLQASFQMCPQGTYSIPANLS